MRMIAIWHTKGGVGKSTIAVNLGLALHKMGKKVLLVDSDTQETTLHLSRRFKEPEAISYCQFDKRKARKYDYVIVDTVGIDTKHPVFEQSVVPVLKQAHGVIIPWTLTLATEDENLSGKIRSVLSDYKIRLFGIIFNQATHYRDYRRKLAEFKINLGDISFRTSISQSKKIQENTILDIPKDKVAKEFDSLANEFVERVK